MPAVHKRGTLRRTGGFAPPQPTLNWRARQPPDSLWGERDSNRQVLESAAADLAAAQTRNSPSHAGSCRRNRRAGRPRTSAGGIRVAIFDTVSSASRLRNQLAQAEERLAGADREARRLETEFTNANLQVEAFGGQRGQLALEFETVTQRVAGIAEEISQLRRLLESNVWKRRGRKTNLDLLRAEFATALGKEGSLEAVIASMGIRPNRSAGFSNPE